MAITGGSECRLTGCTVREGWRAHARLLGQLESTGSLFSLARLEGIYVTGGAIIRN